MQLFLLWDPGIFPSTLESVSFCNTIEGSFILYVCVAVSVSWNHRLLNLSCIGVMRKVIYFLLTKVGGLSDYLVKADPTQKIEANDDYDFLLTLPCFKQNNYII